jgi:hypothetical protein
MTRSIKVHHLLFCLSCASWPHAGFSSVQRRAFVFVVVRVCPGLDVLELVDFPHCRGFFCPVVFFQSHCRCLLEQVVVLRNVE